jgi:CMP/dCMP kinase
MMGKKLTVAIDGPSGAGKSTVAKSLARRLGYSYIDTGAMYRTVALKAKENGISTEEDDALYHWVSSIDMTFVTGGEETHVFCSGEDITEAIRSPEISRLASDISKKKGVREALVEKQRKMGRDGGVVLEGRDIGTVVFPNADVKFYLDARTEERARRRFKELVEKGIEADLEETLEEMIERDHNDMSRALAPLKKADDAILIDSTDKSADEVVEEMARMVNDRMRGLRSR